MVRRPRQQVADGGGDAPSSAQGRFETRIDKRYGGIDAIESSVVRRAQCAFVYRDRDVGVGQRALEEIGS